MSETLPVEWQRTFDDMVLVQQRTEAERDALRAENQRLERDLEMMYEHDRDHSAENKRLKTQLINQHGEIEHYRQLEDVFEAKSAENERLKSEIGRAWMNLDAAVLDVALRRGAFDENPYKDAVEEGARERNALRAEAKALSNQIAVTNVELADAMRERDALRAEVERLTRRLEWHEPLAREVERLTLADKQWADHVERLSEEIERLRKAYDMEVRAEKLEIERLQSVDRNYQTSTADLLSENESARNNGERVIAILTPLFVKAQEHPYSRADEEAIGGALDVLTGWFGQNGKPLRKLDEMEGELAHARSLIEQLLTAVHWNEERRDIQAKEIERLAKAEGAFLAEIERLNAERQGWADTFAQNMKVIGAENERLRAELVEWEAEKAAREHARAAANARFGQA